MGGVLNIMGVLYASTLFLGIINCMSVQHLIAVQRAVMYRERAAGVYNVLPFSLAQVSTSWEAILLAFYSCCIWHALLPSSVEV